MRAGKLILTKRIISVMLAAVLVCTDADFSVSAAEADTQMSLAEETNAKRSLAAETVEETAGESGAAAETFKGTATDSESADEIEAAEDAASVTSTAAQAMAKDETVQETEAAEILTETEAMTETGASESGAMDDTLGAGANIASGTYKNITWMIDKAGKLTVTGTGEFLDDLYDRRSC